MSDDELIALLRLRMEAMTAEDRLAVLDELIEGWCPHCGGAGGRTCQCWNDE